MRCSGAGVFLPARERLDRQRDGRVPAPARGEQRRIEQRLDQHLLGAAAVEEARQLLERKAVGLAERQHDRILGGRRLQLEIERAAEALAQHQAEGAIDAGAERRVDHQVHVAGFVEEALEHQPLLRRQHARAPPWPPARYSTSWRAADARQLIALRRPAAMQAAIVARIDRRQRRVDLGAQRRHRRRQFGAARRRLAQPERHRRRLPPGVFDPHPAGLDPQDAIGAIAELEHVAGQALDREILVQRADEGAGSARAPPGNRRCREWRRRR